MAPPLANRRPVTHDDTARPVATAMSYAAAAIRRAAAPLRLPGLLGGQIAVAIKGREFVEDRFALPAGRRGDSCARPRDEAEHRKKKCAPVHAGLLRWAPHRANEGEEKKVPEASGGYFSRSSRTAFW